MSFDNLEEHRREGIDKAYVSFSINKKHQLSEEPNASYENYDLTVYNIAEMIDWLKIRLRKSHERVDELEKRLEKI